jgi:hypothetical protein
MPTFEIKTPKGTFSVTAPDEEAALGALQQAGEMDAPAQEGKSVGGFVQNIGEDAYNTAAGIAGGLYAGGRKLVTDPVGAAGDVYKAGDTAGAAISGGLGHLYNAAVPSAVEMTPGPDMKLASKVGGHLKDRYWDNLGNTLYEHPVQSAMDAASVAYGGAGLATKGSMLNKTLGAVAEVTNPLNAIAKPVQALRGTAVGRNATRQAPASDDLATASNRLYEASEAQGVRFNEVATTKLRNNLKYVAGEVNDKLRPLTSGTVDDVNKMLNGEMSLKQIDEFRQGLGLDLKAAKGQDKLYLTRMKTIVDGFLDNAAPGEMTGGPQGVEMLKEARKLWAQSKKTETIENIMDQAGVDGAGKYTQSGFANAIRREMNNLYKSIKKGKEQGWTTEEIALIRQMASGGSASKTVNLFSKFAPRGVVSFGAGQLVGSVLPGAGNVMLPLAGEVAARAADRGALHAAQRLRASAATGQAPGAPATRLPPLNTKTPLLGAQGVSLLEGRR